MELLKPGYSHHSNTKKYLPFVESRDFSGFESPTCTNSENRFIAFLLEQAQHGVPQIHFFSARPRTGVSTHVNTTGLLKSPHFGTNIYFCLTGPCAGWFAAHPEELGEDIYTEQEIEDDIYPEAIFTRPILSHTTQVEPARNKLLAPYMDGQVLNVLDITLYLLDTMHIEHDPKIITLNSTKFTSTHPW